MKYKIFKATTITICLFVFLFFAKGAFASTLHLSPGSGTVGVGGTLAVRVTLNTQGEGVNGVSAYLSYPSDKLDVAYVTGAGTFGIEAEKSFGGGAIRISRGSINPVSGNVTVATIGFRGKSLGLGTVSFIGGSAAPRATDSSDSLNLGGSSGGVYTVVAGQPSAKPGQPQTKPAQDITPPAITDVTVFDTTKTSATITWKTDKPADTTVEYGLEEGKYFLSSTNGELATDHSISLESPIFVPGALFHFKAISKDAAGNIAESSNMTFQLKGYTVVLKVVDKNKRPIKNVEVLLYSEPKRGMTNQDGLVTFTDATPGKHLVAVRLKNNLSKTTEIEVIDDPNEQSFTITVESGTSDMYLTFLLLVLAFVGLLGLVSTVLLIKRRRRAGVV